MEDRQHPLLIVGHRDDEIEEYLDELNDILALLTEPLTEEEKAMT